MSGCEGKPTQYITQRQEFYGREFHVNSDVLIPRPETEHLVEAAIDVVRTRKDARVLDIGTGSGRDRHYVGSRNRRARAGMRYFSKGARDCERNRGRHKARVTFFAGDLCLGGGRRSIDLLISNPPYVPGADAANMQREVRDWEPHVAFLPEIRGSRFTSV